MELEHLQRQKRIWRHERELGMELSSPSFDLEPGVTSHPEDALEGMILRVERIAHHRAMKIFKIVGLLIAWTIYLGVGLPTLLLGDRAFANAWLIIPAPILGVFTFAAAIVLM